MKLRTFANKALHYCIKSDITHRHVQYSDLNYFQGIFMCFSRAARVGDIPSRDQPFLAKSFFLARLISEHVLVPS